jgi:hypothetical protein
MTGSPAFLAAAAWAALAVAGAAWAAPADQEPAPASVKVGEFTVNLLPPEGMSPVMGLNPKADRFLYRMDERFKLVVLAAYADPEVYLDFCEAMERGEHRTVPNIALVAVPRKMKERSYDGPRAAKEIKRYVTWFSLATNTRLIAMAFERKANSALTKKLGVDLDFEYRVGKLTQVFYRTPSSLGIGVLASFLLGGARSDNYVAATVYQMSDKLVFLSMVGQDRSEAGVKALRAELLGWGQAMAAANEPPMTSAAAPPTPAGGAS